MQLDTGASLADLKFFAEPEHGVPAKRVAAVGERGRMLAELRAQLTSLGLAVLDLEQVGEIRAVLHLDHDRLRTVTVVLDGDVFVHPAGDEAVTADRDPRGFAPPHTSPPDPDRRRRKIDAPA